jgi:hypothetical protein
MADTIILRPTSDAAGAGYTYGMGVWTGYRTGGAAYGGCDEGSLDETDSGFGISRTSDSSYDAGRFEFAFGSPPTGVTITNVAIKAYCRCSSQGQNYFSEAPRVKGFVNVGATRYYQSGPSYVTVAEHLNRNTEPYAGSCGFYLLGTWATNPATAAAWTLSDLASGTFIAGLEAGGVAEGQAGDGIPHSYGGNAAQFDLAQFWVEVTTSPSETFVNPARLSASAALRLLGTPLRIVEFSAPVEFSALQPGSTLYITDPLYPTPDGLGAGASDWQRRPVKVLSVSDGIEPPEIRIRALDMTDRAVTFWSTWRTDVGADTINLTGIPRFDQGGGYTVARTTADWIERPNDRLLVAISADRPRITPFGLLIQGGSFPGYTPGTGELASNLMDNTFARGTGGHGTSVASGDSTAFTSWTSYKAGGGTLFVWKDDHFRFDEATTYARHAKMGSGSAWGTDFAYLYQTRAGHGANYRIRVQLLFAPQAPTLDPAKVLLTLRRKVGATDNDWSAAGWSASLAWKSLVDAQQASGGSAYGHTSYRKYGSYYEYWSEEIDFGASIGDLTLYFPWFQQNNAGLYLHQAKVYHNNLGTGQAQRVIRRVYDVTQASAVTNAADVVDLNNDESYRIALADRGTVVLVFTPLWEHDDLVDGAIKILLALVHDHTNGDRDVLYYERVNASSGRYAFGRVYGGGNSGTIASLDVTSAGATLPQYMVPVKLAIRWTGASGELGLAAKTLDVFRAGVKGTAGVAAQYCRQKATGAYVTVGRLGLGGPASSQNPYQFADGYFADMEFRADVLSDVQIAAAHNRIGQNMPLPTIV